MCSDVLSEKLTNILFGRAIMSFLLLQKVQLKTHI